MIVDTDLNYGVISANFLLCLLLVAGIWAAPTGNFVVVLTSPFYSPERTMNVISAADGRLVSKGRYDWITIAYSDEPGFATRLMNAGALAVMNNILRTGCLKIEDK
jgi:hypothetical protein